MKTYLEIKVPIKYDDPWFEELRSHFAGIPVRWQKDFYHITMVFVDEAPEGVNLRPVLEKHLSAAHTPVLTFDRLDVFSVKSGMYVIHLSTSHVPERFLALTETIRKEMRTAGCVIHSDFMLHGTLGRVTSFDVKLSDLNAAIDAVSSPSITLTLTDVDYREFRGQMIYKIILEKPKE